MFQLDYPTMVEGLLLININPCAEGWMDWAAHKVTHMMLILTAHTHILKHHWLVTEYDDMQIKKKSKCCIKN